jgi:hypothetical protein
VESTPKIKGMSEYKTGYVCGDGRSESKRKGWWWSEYVQSTYMCYANRIMKPLTFVLKKGRKTKKSNRGGEFDESILYACMKI